MGFLAQTLARSPLFGSQSCSNASCDKVYRKALRNDSGAILGGSGAFYEAVLSVAKSLANSDKIPAYLPAKPVGKCLVLSYKQDFQKSRFDIYFEYDAVTKPHRISKNILRFPFKFRVQTLGT